MPEIAGPLTIVSVDAPMLTAAVGSVDPERDGRQLGAREELAELAAGREAGRADRPGVADRAQRRRGLLADRVVRDKHHEGEAGHQSEDQHDRDNTRDARLGHRPRGPAPPLLAPGVMRMPRGCPADAPGANEDGGAVRRPRTDGRVRSRRRGDPAAPEDSRSIYEGNRAYEPFPA